MAIHSANEDLVKNHTDVGKPQNGMQFVLLPYKGFLFPFERNPGGKSPHFIKWWDQRRHYGLLVALGYLLAIFVLQRFIMKHRRPYTLKVPLAIWNFGLAAFSTLCIWRTLTDLFLILQNYGFHTSVCSRTRYEFLDAWHLLFMFSKFAELGDTFFLVLRKRPVTFLHLYHHSSVVLFESLCLKDDFSICRWVAAVNAIVHSVMYSYFCIRSVDVHLPPFVRIFVTRLQLAQFLLFLIVILPYIWYVKMIDIPCAMTKQSTKVSYLFAAIQCFLFFRFYYETYVRTRNTKKEL